MSANTAIYTGIWTNWSKGAVSGATLTLSVRDGSILVAVLALFVQFAGGQSWSIICFIMHQLRTTPEARNGLFHQQQATLRNNSSDIGTVWRLAKLSWTWRSHNIKSTRKSLALVLTGLLHLLFFGAAGVLSSHLATLGDEVLLARSQSCGVWIVNAAVTTLSEFTEVEANDLYIQSSIRSSNQYVQDCLKQSSSLPECNIFKRPQLNWTSYNNAQCPFDTDLCLGPLNSSLYFDTGLIDSREDLGINSDDMNRVHYRKTATCSPLTTQGYVSYYNATSPQDTTFPQNATFTTYAAYYGPNQALPSGFVSGGEFENATYITSNFQEFEYPYDTDVAPPYRVIAEAAYPTLPDNGFIPIPALYSPNRSLTLVFAEYNGLYLGPSDDLWLPAHKIVPVTLDSNGNYTSENVYLTDKVVNVLACTEQHQFCNPSLSSNQCTALQSLDQFFIGEYGFLKTGTSEPEPLYSTQFQSDVMNIITDAAFGSSWQYVISNIESSILADNLVSKRASSPLPNNQWILEAENWFEISMANLQGYMVNTVTGPPGTDAQYTYGQANNDTSLQDYCASQIVLRQDFTNFSVLAIALIFTLGGAIICISLFLETLFSYLQLHFKRGLYHQVRWQLDSTLQLQRMAFEEAGLGSWSGGADDVPVTEKEEEFAPAREWDDWHPSIRGKSAAKEMSIHGRKACI